MPFFALHQVALHRDLPKYVNALAGKPYTPNRGLLQWSKLKAKPPPPPPPGAVANPLG